MVGTVRTAFAQNYYWTTGYLTAWTTLHPTTNFNDNLQGDQTTYESVTNGGNGWTGITGFYDNGSAGKVSSGGFTFWISSVTGICTYTLQGSTDHSSWTTLLTNFVGTNGWFTIPLSASSTSYRYYRLGVEAGNNYVNFIRISDWRMSF